MKSKRGYLVILILSVILVIFMSGCVQQEVEIQPSVPEEIVEEATTIPEGSPPIEGEANNLTDVTPEQQDVTVNQPVTPETTVPKPKCSREFSPQFNAEPYYSGPLFDAHFHMPPAFEDEHEESPLFFPEGFRVPVLGEEITLDEILCSFDEEKVTGAFLFYLWNYDNLEQSMQYAAEMKKQLPTGVHLFLTPLELEAEEVDDVVSSNDGVFDGFGEIVFYDPDREGATPDDPISLEINNIADKHDFIVMIHPDKGQETNVENALKKNPNVTFLIHGPQVENSITNMIGKYPNVYYSIDTILIRLPNPSRPSGPLMYTVTSKEEYKGEFTQNFDAMLNDAVNKWKPRIEQHPERFMWGTDRAGDWHFDEEISILVEEFTRAFIARLDPAVQEKFAYKNAEKITAEQQ
ncbi:amidohydrolase family protein [Candidatus Woesearchaeota archaeon]|nr:amidohydrolase family protein [Candidatus Woesearchaeota archaeon]